ncbi:MAG: trigger factor [Bacteroidota bacterium]
MDISKEGDGLTSVIKIKLEPEDYTPQVEFKLKDYRKQAKIDGFRPGTVPMGLVKKMYGKYVLVDVINALLSENLQKYIADNKLRILGEPLPNDDLQKEIDWENDSVFEFAFDVATAPEISVSLSKKNKADYFKIQPDKDMIDKQIESFTSRFGTQETVDSIQGDEFIKGNVTQVTDNDEPYSKEDVSMLLSKVATEAESDIFKNAKIGDTIVFNPKKAFENDTEIASMLGIDKENTELMQADYKLEITEILRFKKAEINQELFDKVFGEGEISSEKEFNQRIIEDLEKQLAPNSDYKFFYDFRDKLVKSQKIELPEEFLKRWLLETNKDNDKVTPEQIESDFEVFLDDLRWQLISGKLMQDNEIQVSQEDIIEGAKEFTRMQFAQFGMHNPPEEDLEKWSMEILKNKEEANKIYETEQQRKLIEFLKETVKLDEKKISFDEFKEMIEQK